MPERRRFWKTLALLLAILLAAPALRAHDLTFPKGRGVLVTQKGAFPIELELALEPRQWAHGLMFREELPEDYGMLFDFGAPRAIAMWMKNTYVPLDMVFFDRELRVVWIYRNAQPLDTTTIRPPMPVRYVLELPAGAVARYGLEPGDRLRLAPLG